MKRLSNELDRQSQSNWKLISRVWQTIFSTKEVVPVRINSKQHLGPSLRSHALPPPAPQQDCAGAEGAALSCAPGLRRALHTCPLFEGEYPGRYSSALARSSERSEDSCVAAKHRGSCVTLCSHLKRFFPRVQRRWQQLPCPHHRVTSGGDRPDTCGRAF